MNKKINKLLNKYQKAKDALKAASLAEKRKAKQLLMLKSSPASEEEFEEAYQLNKQEPHECEVWEDSYLPTREKYRGR